MNFSFSITTMNAILDFLVQIDFITKDKKAEIIHQLSGTLGAINGATAISWSLENRKHLLSKNKLNKRIIDIIMSKQTNLCIAADFTKTEEIIKVEEYP